MKKRPEVSKSCIGYVRVSTEEQRLGPRAQADAIAAWAKRNGLSLTTCYIDHGISGATPVSERPGLVAALAALQPGAVLVAAKRDRLARSTAIASHVEAMVTKAGATVRTADGGSDASGSAGVMMRGIQDVFAEYERAVIRERTTAALAVKKARGERVGSIPYGFTVAGDGARLEPLQAEQRVIRLAHELREAGLSTRTIAVELTKRGYRARSGGAFIQTQIVRLLRVVLAAA